jgi:hypothetical protein
MKKSITKVAQVPLTSLLKRQLDYIKINETFSREECLEGILTIFVREEDVSTVKVSKGREKRDTIKEYLEEMPAQAIACAYDILLDGALGQPWRRVGCGFSYFVVLQWLAKLYPVLECAMRTMDKLRERARAERVLDRLESFVNNEDGDANANARVKACELLLRATHRAFGASTDAKVDTSRPIININLANVFGANDTKTVKDCVTI